MNTTYQEKIARRKTELAQRRLLLARYGDVREAWHRLAARSDNASLYHSPRWIGVLERAYGFGFWVAGLSSDDSELEAALLFAVTGGILRRARAVALPFSDYCPPLAHESLAALELVELLPQCLGRSDRASRTTLTFDAIEIRGFEAPAPYHNVRSFQNWELDLTRPLAQLERALEGNFRRAIARARLSGVTVERGCELELMRRFYALHLATRRRLGVPVQPFRFFRLVAEEFAGDCEVWIARERGQDASALVLLRSGGRVYYKWGARCVENPSPNANHLLLWSVIEEYCGKADVLDCGRADVRNEGLSRFKKHLGARPVPLPYAFFPTPAHDVSPEVSLSTWRRIAAAIWRRMPLRATQALSAILYRALA